MLLPNYVHYTMPPSDIDFAWCQWDDVLVSCPVTLLMQVMYYMSGKLHSKKKNPSATQFWAHSKWIDFAYPDSGNGFHSGENFLNKFEISSQGQLEG